MNVAQVMTLLLAMTLCGMPMASLPQKEFDKGLNVFASQLCFSSDSCNGKGAHVGEWSVVLSCCVRECDQLLGVLLLVYTTCESLLTCCRYDGLVMSC